MARQHSVTRTIEAAAETVWALLTDADGYRNWNESIVSIEGPIAVGNSVKLVSVVNPKRTFSLKVTEMTEPRRMVWEDGMPLGLSRAFGPTPSRPAAVAPSSQ